MLRVNIATESESVIFHIIVKHLSDKNHPLVIANANPEILLRAYKDKDYRNIINAADIVIPDGVGAVFFLRLLYGIKVKRIAGVDLAYQIIACAQKQQKSIFILGGTDEANKKACSNLKIQGLGGKFSEHEAIKKIQEVNPAILFVALGSPSQELFIHKLSAKPRVTMSVGGAVDFWANPGLRAPKFLQDIGLEWLWRLLRQPWRVKRIFNAAIVFPIICLYDFFHQKKI